MSGPVKLVDHFEVVRSTLEVAEELGITLHATASLFRLKINEVGSWDNLEQILMGTPTHHTETLCDIMLNLKVRLDQKVGLDTEAQRKWLEESLEGQNIKSLMISGNFIRLTEAIQLPSLKTA